VGRHLGGSGHGHGAGVGGLLVLLGDLRGGVHGLVLGLGYGTDDLVNLGGTLLVVLTGRSVSLRGRSRSHDGRRGGSLVAVRTLLVVRSRRVNVSEVTLDGVVVLVVLVDTAGHIDVGGVREVGCIIIIITGGTTHGSATASLTARRVRTAERRMSTEDDGAGATEVNGRTRVDILVLQVNGVVILAVLVDTSVGGDGTRSAEALATVISRGATHGGATLLMLASPATLEGSTPGREVGRRVYILVLEINGVVVLAVLVHVGLEVAGDGLAEANSVVVTGRTAHSGATVGVSEARMAVLRTTTGSTHGCTTLFLGTPTLLKGRGRSIECCGGRTSGTAMVTMGRSVERRGRVDINNGRVNVLVLDSNGVIILVVVVHLRLEGAGDGHIEALALIVARGATHSSAARGPTLFEGAHARDLRTLHNYRVTEVEMVRRVHILVLQVDGVVILAVLVDLRLGLDIGSVGTDEATITVISRGTAHSGATSMGYRTILLLYSSSGHMFVWR
jgi:hypothetical protein